MTADQSTPQPLTEEAAAPRRRRLAVVVLGAAALTLAADVISKVVVVDTLSDRFTPVTLIPHVLDLELTRNSGAAFSVGDGATLLFTLVAIGVVVAIVRTLPRLVSAAWAVVLGLLLGGALGNLTDRLTRSPGFGRGEVVDWIHLHHWPIFNLADSAIVVGGALAVILTSRGVPATRPKTDAEGPAA